MKLKISKLKVDTYLTLSNYNIDIYAFSIIKNCLK